MCVHVQKEEAKEYRFFFKWEKPEKRKNELRINLQKVSSAESNPGYVHGCSSQNCANLAVLFSKFHRAFR